MRRASGAHKIKIDFSLSNRHETSRLSAITVQLSIKVRQNRIRQSVQKKNLNH